MQFFCLFLFLLIDFEITHLLFILTSIYNMLSTLEIKSTICKSMYAMLIEKSILLQQNLHILNKTFLSFLQRIILKRIFTEKFLKRNILKFFTIPQTNTSSKIKDSYTLFYLLILFFNMCHRSFEVEPFSFFFSNVFIFGLKVIN
jgi:hypothetical protein